MALLNFNAKSSRVQSRSQAVFIDCPASYLSMTEEQYEHMQRENAVREHEIALKVGSKIESVKSMAVPWLDDAIMFLDRSEPDIDEAIQILREIRLKFQQLN